MRWFRPFRAAPDLAATLSCRWLATAAGRHHLVPDGAMDLLWIERGGLWLCGPDTRAWDFELPAGREVAGVRFHPGAAASVFHLPATDLLDQRIPLEGLTGARTVRLLGDELADATTPVQRMAALEGFVRRAQRDATPDAFVAGAVGALASGRLPPGNGAVDRLAGATALTTRQVHRRFSAAVGYGPAFFGRVARLQRFLRCAALAPDATTAALAADVGYADQSHLSRDCRAIAALTPTEARRTLERTSVAVELDDV